jgi:hypothetical protein
MIIIKTLSDKVVVFDENGLQFFNHKDSLKYERLLFSFFFILLACAGILLKPNHKINFFSISWLLLLIVWIVYFVNQLLKQKYPEKLSFSEIEKISISQNRNRNSINIFYNQNKKPLRLFTSTLDDKLLPFLEERNIKIEKPNL